MDIGTTVNNDLEVARQIIRTYLADQSRSMTNLAEAAGLNKSIVSRFLRGSPIEEGSAIKLYNVMYKSLATQERRQFIEASGLMPLATALSPEFLYKPDHQYGNPFQIEPFQVGTNLMMGGHRLAGQLLCAEAIIWFQNAEQILGKTSTLAARSACMTALMHTELGDYSQAIQELDRIPTMYGTVMDPVTKELMYRVYGWVAYHQGNYALAEQMFSNCLSVAAQSEEERLGETAQHFLGRVYGDWSLITHNPQQRQHLVQKAVDSYHAAFDLHLRCGFGDDHAGLDLVREAQLLQAQSDWERAKELRSRARQMFRRNIHKLHIDLDEAQLMLEDGEVDHSRYTVEEILHRWAEINKANGMAKALRVLGDIEIVKGKPEQGLELYISALCVYPELEYSASERQMSLTLTNIFTDIVRRDGPQRLQSLLQHIQQKADQRLGYFSYLGSVTADRQIAVTKLFQRLSSRDFG